MWIIRTDIPLARTSTKKDILQAHAFCSGCILQLFFPLFLNLHDSLNGLYGVSVLRGDRERLRVSSRNWHCSAVWTFHRRALQLVDNSHYYECYRTNLERTIKEAPVCLFNIDCWWLYGHLFVSIFYFLMCLLSEYTWSETLSATIYVHSTFGVVRTFILSIVSHCEFLFSVISDRAPQFGRIRIRGASFQLVKQIYHFSLHCATTRQKICVIVRCCEFKINFRRLI